MKSEINRKAVGQILVSSEVQALVDQTGERVASAIESDEYGAQLKYSRDDRQRTRAGGIVTPDGRKDAYRIAKSPALLLEALARG